MVGEPHGGLRAIAEATQDWMVVQDSDGKLVAKAEQEYTWREEEDGVRLFVLISPEGRGAKLDFLNKNGFIMVDIKANLVRIVITDIVNRKTWRFQWLNLWEEIDPEKSKYHLSADNKRIVVWLQKVKGTGLIDIKPKPWGDLVTVWNGKYNKWEMGWPSVLCDVQGTWRSEDEEPIEIVGHQVVWPEGSRDFLFVDEEDETFKLIQLGDGERIVETEFSGIYERHAERMKWDDGDYWTRVPGLDFARREADRLYLPLQFDQQLSRWVPWLPSNEYKKQVETWMPPTSTSITLQVNLSDGLGDEVRHGLLKSADDDSSETKEIVMGDPDYIPSQLLLKCRICSLSAEEVTGSSLVPTMFALRDCRQVSPQNEVAAFGGLECWLRWIRCWLAPGSRQNIDKALEITSQRNFELASENRHSGHGQTSSSSSSKTASSSCDRWPPMWVCTLSERSSLHARATDDLIRHLQSKSQLKEAHIEPRKAFVEASRHVAERLFDDVTPKVGSRRCDPLERRWARRYAEEASRTLFDEVRTRHLQHELKEGGLMIIEDTLDWGTLVKAHGETLRLLGSEVVDYHEMTVFLSRGGHVRWATVWESKLQNLGMVALSACVCLASQLTVRLNEWKFDNCTWCAEDPILWYDNGRRLDLSRQQALEWETPESVSEPMATAARDDDGHAVPAERCLLMFMFMFLNTPGWVPEWGGALRCHVGTVFRDVWGDGGRIVLLRESSKYELLGSSHSHAVLIMRLQGSRMADVKMQPLNAEPRSQAEKEQQLARMREVKRMPPKGPERPESYSRVLTATEVKALGKKVGVKSSRAEDESDEDEEYTSEDEEEVDELDTAPPKLDLDSTQAIKLFEISADFAFKLD